MTLVSINRLAKRYGHREVISDFSVDIEPGKIYSIVAPSGCGKTTLLKIIAGFDRDYAGSIIYNFDRRTHPIGFIFQEQSIFPWLTVRENLGFGIENTYRKHDSLSHGNIELLSNQLGLSAYLNFYPHQLSGGLKQRVVFGRTLILNPKIILCDEPFNSLDENAAFEMLDFLKSIQKTFQITVLYVTHNVEEAVYIADELLISKSGINKNTNQITLSNLKNDKFGPNPDQLHRLSAEIRDLYLK
ncbi:ABC transporter ATP-binding protein [Mucilaginibacter xinganensis]|nr:ABC transporter ATP-binding protein [Mucilaginibacter xinganensis]